MDAATARGLRWPLAAAIAVLLGCVVWILWPERPESIDLVSAVDPDVPDERIVDAATDFGDDVLIAARRLVVRGVVTPPPNRVLAANEIRFDPAARIAMRGGAMTLVAPVMRAVRLELAGTSGAEGATAGARGVDGGTGGTVFLAAALLDDVHVDVSGGPGGNGRAGAPGVPGRNGYCGPRGFRLAERGRDGGDGGVGGDGGDGGLLTALYGDKPPIVVAAGGAPGRGGAGGGGGAGGRGCEGVRGRQDEQPPGNDGIAGRPGRAGDPGVTTLRPSEFADVETAFERWLAGEDRSAGALRDLLLRVPARDD